MSAPMTDPARPGRSRELFRNLNATLPMDQCASTACYSLASNGQAFYTMRFRPRTPPRVTSVRLVVNWFEEVRRLSGRSN